MQIAVEGRAIVGNSLSLAIRELFLEQEFEPELLSNNLVLALLTKCFKAISSSHLIRGEKFVLTYDEATIYIK